MSDTPDPIGELRKCLSEPRFTTSKAITDALAAYDAKCAEVSSLRVPEGKMCAEIDCLHSEVETSELLVKGLEGNLKACEEELREAEAKVEQLKKAFEEGRSRVYANFSHTPTAIRAADWMWISFSKAINTPPTIEQKRSQ